MLFIFINYCYYILSSHNKIMKKEYKNLNIEDLKNLAKEIKNILNSKKEREDRTFIIFLKGDLGSGKTTFTKEIGKIFGIEEDIISPTFILRKDYKNIIHIDGYRFEKEEEGKVLELEKEIEDGGKIIIIEWPERFVNALNIKPDIILEFKIASENGRDITIFFE